jgi:hypothetical protein
MKSSDTDRRPARRMAAPAKAAAVLFSVALLVCGFQTKPAETPPDKAPKCSLEGTVLDARAGAPIKDATLLLVNSTGTGVMGTTKTDEKGHFLFKDVETGQYVLLGEHPRYARQTYGSRNGLMGGTLLTLTAGLDMKELTFKLLPNGVVSGKVLDSDGEPIAKVLVAANKSMYQHGRRMLMPLATAMTNDLGEYRLANLAAGRYAISATLIDQGAAAPPAKKDEPETAFITTYYPNAVEESSAGTVEVAAGGDAAGMDIKMAKARSVRIKGKVVGELKDQNVTVRAVPRNAGVLAMIIGRYAKPKADGTFEITGVPAGSYTLKVGDQTGMKVLGAPVAIEVGDKPIEGAVVEVGTNADLPGSVVVSGEDAKPAAGIALKGMKVMLEAMEGLSLAPPNTTVAEDGAFTLKELPPDRYLVRVTNGPPNSYLESAQAAGQAMTDRGLDLGRGAGRLEIKLRLGAARINGVVRGTDDNPISGVTVALIPDSHRYPLYNSTFTDQNGAFEFKNVTPGDYKLLSWEDVEPGVYMDPEFVKPFEARGEALTLKNGEQKAVTVKVIPKGQ